jgi:hypothetical protein
MDEDERRKREDEYAHVYPNQYCRELGEEMAKELEQEEQMEKAVKKKVTLTLVGLDSNAFSLLGAFQSQARREKWTNKEIKAVIDEATSSDYDHLLMTLMNHCEDGDENK